MESGDGSEASSLPKPSEPMNQQLLQTETPVRTLGSWSQKRVVRPLNVSGRMGSKEVKVIEDPESDSAAKKPRLDQMLLHDQPSHDTPTIMFKLSNRAVSDESLGSQSTPIEKEKTKRAKRRKNSHGKNDKKSKKEKKKEIEKIQQAVQELRSENSKLAQNLRWISQQCQDKTDENALLLEELEGSYGSKEISDLTHSNPATSDSHGSDSNRERSSGDDSITGGRKSE